MSWADDKNLGPWDFTEQPDKWGYLNNLRWSSQADAIAFCQAHGLPLDLPGQHLPCGHWHKNTPSPPVATGRWVAAMQQPGTPYIYLYDVTYKAVIKIDTSTNPVTLAEVFPINATYQLDSNYGSTQRGGFCMNKDGTRIWYLFREDCTEDSSGSKNNCELIEVDISGVLMKKVKSTIYPDLVECDYGTFHEEILDGCSDNTYTYWATSEITGRLIKIRNSDHVIAIDKRFNFSPPAEGIHSIDCHSNGLYWSYVLKPLPYKDHHIKSDTNFNVIIDNVSACFEGGINQPIWWNLVRILNGYILQHRNYNPGWGHFVKRNLDWTCTDFYNDQQYLRNILGVKNGKLFTLLRENSVRAHKHLQCAEFSDMSGVSTRDVSYYTKLEPEYKWESTNVSAMNQQTGVIVIVRYHNIELRNYVACFKADSSFDLICDEGLDVIEKKEGMISDEPMIWQMPE